MEVSISQIIRDTKNVINARLDILETIVNLQKTNTFDSNIHIIKSLNSRILDLEIQMKELLFKNSLEQIPEIIITKSEELVNNDTSLLTEKGVTEVSEVEGEGEGEGEGEAEGEVEEEGEEGEDEGEGEGEYTPFEYKNMTLYHDKDMIVYQIDEEGNLSDPIGKYDAEKKKIKKL